MSKQVTVEEMRVMSERIKNSVGAPKTGAIELAEAVKSHLRDCSECVKSASYKPVDIASHLYIEFQETYRRRGGRKPSKPTGKNIQWALRWNETEARKQRKGI